MPSLFADVDAGAAYPQIRRIAQSYGLDAYVLTQDYLDPGPGVHLIPVQDDPRAGHNWIAAHLVANDICITGQGELAARCLLRGAAAVDLAGSVWTRECLAAVLAAAAPKVALLCAAVQPQRLARQLEALIARSQAAGGFSDIGRAAIAGAKPPGYIRLKAV